jgi:1,4-dihydroxy-2-naphthoate octaprenyltransferase
MATRSQWLDGLRLRTLPAAISPVLVGVGAAWQLQTPLWGRAALALTVALALQIGVNFANDYSDGVRGTDASRTGPQRLVASGAASPGAVKAVAFGFFAVAGIAGLALTWLTGQWWLIAVGVACVGAAWFYTGGSHPYGYRALGELGVFIFFGPVAVLGTMYTQTMTVTWRAIVASVGIGLLACALLMANNLRDVATDTKAGKITLAVKLGDSRARTVYTVEMWLAIVAALACAIGRVQVAAVLLMAIPTAKLTSFVGSGAKGKDLIRVLQGTGQVELCYAILFGLALANLGLFNR